MGAVSSARAFYADTDLACKLNWIELEGKRVQHTIGCYYSRSIGRGALKGHYSV
jgi:hypothetical protein